MTANRIALITGANKGIGFEIARQLAQAGVHVLIGARDDDRGRAAVADLARQGLAAQALRLDVTDGASIGAAALPTSACRRPPRPSCSNDSTAEPITSVRLAKRLVQRR